MSNEVLAEFLTESVEKEAATGEHWITVNGNAILIGADGSPKAGNPKALGMMEFKPNTRIQRAIAGYVSANAAEQRLADKTEIEMAKAIGIPRTGNNLPFDLHGVDSRGRGVGVEVKLIIKQTNDKITMNKAAIERKLKAAKENKLKNIFTLVVDKRGEGRPIYYLKKGVGSFRIGSMERIGSLKELKQRIKG